jgi:hypothetical protein
VSATAKGSGIAVPVTMRISANCAEMGAYQNCLSKDKTAATQLASMSSAAFSGNRHVKYVDHPTLRPTTLTMTILNWLGGCVGCTTKQLTKDSGMSDKPCARCDRPRLDGDAYCLEHRRQYRREHARLQRRILRRFRERGLSMETMDTSASVSAGSVTVSRVTDI